ncbi:DUF1456 family protein [Thalassotalea profundi]|uniref:DUF1456 family protein n=1 Tax=Thalassotalea profundi TaxID=2036687 RepID=A0ABQ3IBM1_9GAMM|nr:DUF1456 family protein [Thalassotalea profundi]GHE77211.1 hypothetical protein GCM10011501_00850 [Thalassotalea profundi]
MTNNDVLRRIRYAFDLRDTKLVKIFANAGLMVDLEQVKRWLKKDDDEQMLELADVELASFLNGFIIEKRGPRSDGKKVEAETTLTKNLILMKLKIALSLQTDDIVGMLAKTGFSIGQSELTAFFRKPDHKNYRHCKAQFLRNFIQAIQEQYRPSTTQTRKVNNKVDTFNKPNATKSNQESTVKSYAKPRSKKTGAKTLYVNPNASKPETKLRVRKVLKLKPEDIYKQ